MEYKNKEGRRSQGHNGYHLDGSTSPSHNYSEASSQNEVMQSKPRGGSEARKSGSFRMEKVGRLDKSYLFVHTTQEQSELKSLYSIKLDELGEFKCDIIDLAETRREGKGLEEIKGGA